MERFPICSARRNRISLIQPRQEGVRSFQLLMVISVPNCPNILRILRWWNIGKGTDFWISVNAFSLVHVNVRGWIGTINYIPLYKVFKSHSSPWNCNSVLMKMKYGKGRTCTSSNLMKDGGNPENRAFSPGPGIKNILFLKEKISFMVCT